MIWVLIRIAVLKFSWCCLVLREFFPSRSSVLKKSSYRLYKDDLRADFGGECGYCSSPDAMFGGYSVFHIDHFAPHSKFPLLKEEYTNLVYSCPSCNRAKSDKWVGGRADISHNETEGFVDPCCETYEEQLDRDFDGQFIASSEVGRYMIKNLRLYLARHQYVWQAKQIRRLRERLRVLIASEELVDQNKIRILSLIDELTQAYEQFSALAIEKEVK